MIFGEVHIYKKHDEFTYRQHLIVHLDDAQQEHGEVNVVLLRRIMECGVLRTPTELAAFDDGLSLLFRARLLQQQLGSIHRIMLRRKKENLGELKVVYDEHIRSSGVRITEK